ncbi:MAG: HEAT repeat domain-containing protein [Pirellulales bacterium]|nr:HEAT repeat domain-containing protein [Pirellulales bacterium]
MKAPERKAPSRWGKTIAGLTCLGLWMSVAVAADAGERTYRFKLTSGGELRGTLQNENESPRERYIIKTELGVLTLDREQIVEKNLISDARLAYENVRENYPDTAEGQWELAEWCRDNFLPNERREHAQRVLEHDPDHKPARGMLGFFLDRSNGRWITPDQLRREQGYVRYNGEWLLQQQVDLREERRIAEESRVYWVRQVAQLHRMLTGRRSEAGRVGLLQIKDPAALYALEPHIRFDKEEDPRVRELYVQVVSSVGTSAAVGLLSKVILMDPSDEVRHRAIQEVAKHKDPKTTRFFVQQLTANKNEDINRAAAALSAIGDPSAVGTLINSLITTHIETKTEGNPDQITTTMGSNGVSGMTTGSKTETRVRTRKNEDVRNALINLTGKNFGWDMDLWKAWFAAETRTAIVNPRRGR